MLYKNLALAFALLYSVAALAQRTVSGVVTDASGEPLIGVTVLLEGTSTGTATDFDGNYEVTVPGRDAALIFSYVSYATQRREVGDASTIDIVLEAEAGLLDEIVVVGYGVERKSDLTGAVASVGTQAIQQLSVGNVAESIKGRIPGVEIATTDPSPGTSPTIRIRGTNTINGSNEPLVVVDGFTRAGDLRALNPRDIKSIEVLKDASATAIYGARGSNGVILVTTFSGQPGPPKFNASTALRIKRPVAALPLLDAQQFLTLRRDLGFNVSDEEIASAETRDWQDLVYRQGLEQNYQVGFSGGTEALRYNVSGNYFDDVGVVENSFFNRWSLRGQLSADLNKYFTFSNSTYVSANSANGTPRNTLNYLFDPSLSTSALTFFPDLPIRDAVGNFTSTETTTNPVAIATERQDLTEQTFNYTYSTLDFKPLPGLVLRSTFGITKRSSTNKQYWPQTVTNVTDEGIASVNLTDITEWSQENIVTYNKRFGKHSLGLTSAFSQEKVTGESFGTRASGFATDDLSVFNLAGAAQSTALSSAYEQTLQSVLGRVTYNYANRYYFTASARRDGDSRFAKDNKWGTFPGAAVAWRASEESWMKGVEWLDNLKLRVSYGVTGNASALGPYESQLRYIVDGLNGASIFNGVAQPSLRLTNLANPNLRWERSPQFNAGIDISVIDERVSLSVDAYTKRTEDLLLLVRQPDVSPLPFRRENVGALSNRGLEIALQTVNVRSEKFTWSTTFNFGLVRNRIEALADANEVEVGPFQGLMDTPPVLLRVGDPLGSFYGYVYEGIFANNAERGLVDYTSVLNRADLGGYIKLRDVNQDNRLTADDRVIMGNAQPDFSFGFINAFAYGPFDLNIYIQGVIGQEVYNLTRYYTENTNLRGNVSTTVLDQRWTPEQPNGANLPGIGQWVPLANSSVVEDGSYIKFRDIQLGYTLPTSVASRLGLGDVRAFVAGQNLLWITDYSGYDPEVSFGGSSTTLQGLDLGAYPSTRSVTVGLNLDF